MAATYDTPYLSKSQQEREAHILKELRQTLLSIHNLIGNTFDFKDLVRYKLPKKFPNIENLHTVKATKVGRRFTRLMYGKVSTDLNEQRRIRRVSNQDQALFKYANLEYPPELADQALIAAFIKLFQDDYKVEIFEKRLTFDWNEHPGVFHFLWFMSGIMLKIDDTSVQTNPDDYSLIKLKSNCIQLRKILKGIAIKNGIAIRSLDVSTPSIDIPVDRKKLRDLDAYHQVLVPNQQYLSAHQTTHGIRALMNVNPTRTTPDQDRRRHREQVQAAEILSETQLRDNVNQTLGRFSEQLVASLGQPAEKIDLNFGDLLSNLNLQLRRDHYSKFVELSLLFEAKHLSLDKLVKLLKSLSAYYRSTQDHIIKQLIEKIIEIFPDVVVEVEVVDGSTQAVSKSQTEKMFIVKDGAFDLGELKNQVAQKVKASRMSRKELRPVNKPFMNLIAVVLVLFYLGLSPTKNPIQDASVAIEKLEEITNILSLLEGLGLDFEHGHRPVNFYPKEYYPSNSNLAEALRQWFDSEIRYVVDQFENTHFIPHITYTLPVDDSNFLELPDDERLVRMHQTAQNPFFLVRSSIIENQVTLDNGDSRQIVHIQPELFSQLQVGQLVHLKDLDSTYRVVRLFRNPGDIFDPNSYQYYPVHIYFTGEASNDTLIIPIAKTHDGIIKQLPERASEWHEGYVIWHNQYFYPEQTGLLVLTRVDDIDLSAEIIVSDETPTYFTYQAIDLNSFYLENRPHLMPIVKRVHSPADFARTYEAITEAGINYTEFMREIYDQVPKNEFGEPDLVSEEGFQILQDIISRYLVSIGVKYSTDPVANQLLRQYTLEAYFEAAKTIGLDCDGLVLLHITLTRAALIFVYGEE